MSFDMPVVPASLTAQAVNDSGRVAGVFTAAGTTTQSVFWFNGTGVSVVAAYNQEDFVHLALNNPGLLLISDRGSAGPVSYEVTCHGAGC